MTQTVERRKIDNHGIGALYATFHVAQKDGECLLDETNIGDAVSLTHDNEIGLGSDGDQLLGRLEHVAGGLATVQIQGVMRFNIRTPLPTFGSSVCVDGIGLVYDEPDGNGRGLVFAVYDNGTCDVLL